MVEEDKIRKRVSYKTFSDLYKFLDSKPSKAAILKRIHSVVDCANGYGSERNSLYAEESLGLVIKDMEE